MKREHASPCDEELERNEASEDEGSIELDYLSSCDSEDEGSIELDYASSCDSESVKSDASEYPGWKHACARDEESEQQEGSGHAEGTKQEPAPSCEKNMEQHEGSGHAEGTKQEPAPSFCDEDMEQSEGSGYDGWLKLVAEREAKQEELIRNGKKRAALKLDGRGGRIWSGRVSAQAMQPCEDLDTN